MLESEHLGTIGKLEIFASPYCGEFWPISVITRIKIFFGYKFVPSRMIFVHGNHVFCSVKTAIFLLESIKSRSGAALAERGK